MKYHSAVPATSGQPYAQTKRKTRYSLPLKRRSDILTLLRWRLSQGQEIPAVRQTLELVAPALEALSGMKQGRRQGKGVPHPGFTIETATNFIRNVFSGLPRDPSCIPPDPWSRLPEPWLSCAIAMAVEAVDCMPDPEAPFTPSAAAVGRTLGVTRAERENLQLFTFEAIDESAEARKARKQEEKRRADRDRQHAKRRAKAASEARIIGGPSREQLSPWIAEGISRRTWYNRQKRNGMDGCTTSSRTSSLNKGSRQSQCNGDRIASPSAGVIQLIAWVEETRRMARQRVAKILDPNSYPRRNAGARQARPASECGGDLS